ncbi:MAG: sigma-70 family RNA polymerase sigma factor, partial [Planctomycetes bacterium]|nr:sigma-70 family RNA polymerase sigma factor [Planctomycetota bacterium]
MADERFEALVDDFGAMVLNAALRVLGDAGAARDVHQEVFLAIWRRWGKYNGRTKWSPYLYRTAVRKAIEYAKRARRNRPIQENPDIPGREQMPDAPMRIAELQEKLSACLAEMPRRQADVFV